VYVLLSPVLRSYFAGHEPSPGGTVAVGVGVAGSPSTVGPGVATEVSSGETVDVGVDAPVTVAEAEATGVTLAADVAEGVTPAGRVAVGVGELADGVPVPSPPPEHAANASVQAAKTAAA
jgi:hypothetical protein